MLPSGPTQISRASALVVGRANSSIFPVAGSSRPILSAPLSVNQIFLSGPATTPYGLLSVVGTGNSVTFPSGVTRPILLPDISANHTAPSGPGAIPRGQEPLVIGFAATAPDGILKVPSNFPSGVIVRIAFSSREVK